MSQGDGLNFDALRVFESMSERSGLLRVAASRLPCGAHVLDCGVDALGGLQAGLEFARICLAGRASVQCIVAERQVWRGPWVQVTTDHPLSACMLGQYAGWPVKHDDFFAMGSGPMRVRRGKEALLQELEASDADAVAVGTLECDCLPSDALAESMAEECNVPPESLHLAIAPTRSVAGCVQVVARSVETALHKLHELGFPLQQVHSAHGIAPLPPPTPSFAKGIGRTNDAILYGGQVTLWVSGDDEQLAEIGEKLPSAASTDYGAPFAEIFKRVEYDFYKVDPGLFSPAEVILMNVQTGRSRGFGRLRGDLIAQSFATEFSK